MGKNSSQNGGYEHGGAMTKNRLHTGGGEKNEIHTSWIYRNLKTGRKN